MWLKLRNKHKERFFILELVYVFNSKFVYAIGSVACKVNFVTVFVKYIAIVAIFIKIICKGFSVIF